jgi:hypothetical protein
MPLNQTLVLKLNFKVCFIIFTFYWITLLNKRERVECQIYMPFPAVPNVWLV